MWSYIVRRLGIAVVVLFFISILDFMFVNLAPGDPLQAMLSAGGGGANTAASASELRAQAGLNQPLPVRYWEWLSAVLHGNFGTSFITHNSAAGEILSRLPNTVVLAGAGLVLAILIGVPVGVVSGLHTGSAFDHGAALGSFVFFSVPSFFLALIAVYVFAVDLHWFPPTGMASAAGNSGVLDVLWHLVLPATSLGLFHVPVYVRYARSAVVDVAKRDYVRSARARGLSERTVIWGHLFPNALSPLLTITALNLPSLVGGAFLIEYVFGWPGLGTLAIQAATFRDYPVFMATSLVVAVAVLLSNLLADLAYAVVDPRIRLD